MKQETVSENTKRNRKKRNKRTLQYGASILAFVMLIVSALWLPQVFFEFSDALMYGEVNLMEQEKLDVLTLTTGYEESLYRRFAGFAEGLARQRHYYVDEQPKEVTDEIQSLLFDSALRYHAYGIYDDVIMRMFFESFGFEPGSFAKKTEMELYHWNQYVIYSDDYAQGVNFILWCFSLKNAFGDNLTILMDAHDYTVYALQITGGTEHSALSVDTIKIYSIESEESYDSGESLLQNFEYSINFWYTQELMWMALNIYYEIFEQEELDKYYDKIEKTFAMWSKTQLETITDVLKDSAGNEVEVSLDLSAGALCGADGERWYGRDADGILYYNLPVQENKITFELSFGEIYDAGQIINSTIGIRQIYELIPEFGQFG